METFIVIEREREIERGRDERGRGSERIGVCVHVCVRDGHTRGGEREREREIEYEREREREG